MGSCGGAVTLSTGFGAVYECWFGRCRGGGRGGGFGRREELGFESSHLVSSVLFPRCFRFRFVDWNGDVGCCGGRGGEEGYEVG